MVSDFTEFDSALRDGRSVHVRAIRKTDEAELLQAFDRLDPDARYMRFMHAIRAPNLERLRKALSGFPEHGDAIVATIPAADGFDIVGSASFVIGSDPQSCEFAICVAAAFGGAGLGGKLMATLIDAAKKRGLRQMEGYVLAENQPMLQLATRLGFSNSRDPDDASIRICRLHLSDSQVTRPWSDASMAPT